MSKTLKTTIMQKFIITLNELRLYGPNWLEAREAWNNELFVNPGYYYVDNQGNKAHTWDYEESIGE